ncbi:MAG: hypothetical protein MJ168_10045 [Clostridia bacterium]|nr:hypothetical protein [Clostridia bacterium]
MTIEHINLVVQPNNRIVFHRQPIMLLSFTDAIQYIKKHDYRLMQEVEEKKYSCNVI